VMHVAAAAAAVWRRRSIQDAFSFRWNSTIAPTHLAHLQRAGKWTLIWISNFKILVLREERKKREMLNWKVVQNADFDMQNSWISPLGQRRVFLWMKSPILFVSQSNWKCIIFVFLSSTESQHCLNYFCVLHFCLPWCQICDLRASRAWRWKILCTLSRGFLEEHEIWISLIFLGSKLLRGLSRGCTTVSYAASCSNIL
jgi:hypothetical protein